MKAIFITLLFIASASSASPSDTYTLTAFMMFPEMEAPVPNCPKFTFTKVKGKLCDTDDNRSLRLVKYEVENNLTTAAVSIAKNSAEVAKTLKLRCKRDEEYYPILVFREIREDVTLMYMDVDRENEPNVAILFGENMISEQDIKKMIDRFDDLKDRKGTVVCKSFISDAPKP